MRLLLVMLVILTQICFAQGFQDPSRVQVLTNGLPLHGVGLEIAPFFRPTLLKRDYNIFYTDYTTASDLVKKHAHLPIAQEIKENTVEVDFLWRPGTALSKCVRKKKFDYAIASHVIEHVPNVLGWITQIFSVLKTGGILSLAVPDKRYTFDYYRSETQLHELIDTWIRNEPVPTPGQIFDMLTNEREVPYDSFGRVIEGIPCETLPRHFTDQDALQNAIRSFKKGEYLDIHCSVFTPEGLKKLFLKIHDLGILNISVSEPISVGGEFFIQLRKEGEPRVHRSAPESSSRAPQKPERIQPRPEIYGPTWGRTGLHIKRK